MHRTIDEESGCGGSGGCGSGSGVGGENVGGGVQDETDSSYVVVPASTHEPAELRLQSDETTFACLKLFKKCH